MGCAYAQVDPGDVIMLVVSWHFSAAAMCEYSRPEFLRGMAGLGCDSADQLRRMLPRLRAELQDSTKFKARALHGLPGFLRPCALAWAYSACLKALTAALTAAVPQRAGRGCDHRQNKGEVVGDVQTSR